MLKTIDGYSVTKGLCYIYETEEKKMEYSYADLKKDSDQIAVYIHQKQSCKKTPIVVYGHKHPLMLALFLGAAKAGVPYCPLDTTIPKERVEKIIEETQADLVFVLDDAPEEDHWINEEDLATILGQNNQPLAYGMMKAEDVFYIIFTSGSTGDPKGVQISYQNLQSYLSWARDLVEDHPDPVFINQAPFSFDLSVMDLYLSLTLGATLFALDRFQQASFKCLMDRLGNSQGTVWVSTPSFASYCLAESSFSSDLMPRLKTFLFCGETLKNKTVRALRQRFPQADIINTYGPTESTVCVTSLLVDDQILEKYDPLPIGKPKPGSHLIIDKLAESDEHGEILILGDTVSPGYYKSPQLTEKVFCRFKVGGRMLACYRTGDLGYEKDGYFFYVGRKDDQIKLHGYRIELGDIESNLLKLKGVLQAVVLPHYRDDSLEWLTAYLVMEEAPEKPLQRTLSLKKELKHHLMDYMIPKRFVYVDHIPMSPNGKVDRNSLKEMG